MKKPQITRPSTPDNFESPFYNPLELAEHAIKHGQPVGDYTAPRIAALGEKVGAYCDKLGDIRRDLFAIGYADPQKVEKTEALHDQTRYIYSRMEKALSTMRHVWHVSNRLADYAYGVADYMYVMPQADTDYFRILASLRQDIDPSRRYIPQATLAHNDQSADAIAIASNDLAEALDTKTRIYAKLRRLRQARNQARHDARMNQTTSGWYDVLMGNAPRPEANA
jgi:hypothetical protein